VRALTEQQPAAIAGSSRSGQAAHPRRGWRIAANIAKLPGLLRRGAALDRSTSTLRASSSKTR